MGKFLIRGGNSLCGSVCVSGSKNAALPVIFASLSLFGRSEIVGLPDIGDVRVALELVEEQGALITRRGDTTLIDATNLSYVTPDSTLVARLRASTYLIGACLARYGRIELGSYGGCSFSYRPIDYHLSLAAQMGAKREGDTITAPRLKPATVSLPRASVGATVNFLILAASTEGESRLYSPATEPHIDTLIDFLRSAGAVIEREENSITVRGGGLTGGRVHIGGDPIEAGTYICAALATGGSLRILGADPQELSPLLSLISDGGATVDTTLGISVSGCISAPLSVVARPHPGFPTDLQPIVAPLMATSHGGRILDTVWQDRYGYLGELARLGVSYVIDDRGALVCPSCLTGGSANATDLRGGAACVIAALAADGYSEVGSASTVLRGYSHLTEKLRSIGADVEYSPL